VKLLLILWFGFYLFSVDYAARNYRMIMSGKVGTKRSFPKLKSHNPGSFLVMLMKNRINCCHYFRFTAGIRTEHFPYTSQKRYYFSQSNIRVSCILHGHVISLRTLVVNLQRSFTFEKTDRLIFVTDPGYYEGNSISKLQIQVATYVFELSVGNCHR
jgi:hypothetical protein